MYIPHTSVLVGADSIWLSFQLNYFTLRELFGDRALIQKINSNDVKDFVFSEMLARYIFWGGSSFYWPSDPISQAGVTLTMTYDGYASCDVGTGRDDCLLTRE